MTNVIVKKVVETVLNPAMEVVLVMGSNDATYSSRKFNTLLAGSITCHSGSLASGSVALDLSGTVATIRTGSASNQDYTLVLFGE